MSESSKQIAPIDEIRNSLVRMKDQFRMALPPQVDVDRFIRVTITACQNQPSLLKVDRHSLYSACMKAAQSGLLPDGSESAIVKFKDSAAFMPMIKGILKQVRNSGELASITSQVIHKNDRFRYWVDSDGEHLEHEPLFFGERGEKIGVYALAKTKDGGVYIEVMTKEQVMAIRKVSRAQDGPWDGPFEDEMWRKSALRRLSKRLPMSTDLEGLMKADDDLFMPPPTPAEVTPVKSQEGEQGVSEPGPKRASRTAKLVKDAVKKPAQDEEPPLPDKPPVRNYAPGADNSHLDESPI